MHIARLLSAVALLAVAPVAAAATLAGVTMPDTVTVGGQRLTLNGQGLREKFFIDVYVGGLYVPTRSGDAASLIANDVPKRIAMEFTYSEVSAAKLIASFDEALAYQSNAAALRPRYEQLGAMMEDIHSGESMVFDYVPGTGLSVTVKGVSKGIIPGVDFMRSFFTVFIGDNPPTAKLKRGLLGDG